MSDLPSTPGDPADDSPERVEAVLRSVRAGVRQRRAEWAALTDGGRLRSGAALELQDRSQVQEPYCSSARPVLGRLIVFARKAVYHVFMKWWALPFLSQQNDFNQLAAQHVAALLETQQNLRRQVEELEERLARLEGRAADARPPE